MPDVNEMRALKGSYLGAIETASALQTIKPKMMAIDSGSELTADDLDELGRLTLAHAVASQALRGLVEAIRSRRDLG